MKARQRIAFCLLGFLATFGLLRAEEKNGISLSVTKKTLDRNDTRTSYYYADRIDRTQGLKAIIRNTTFKALPEGEVKWTILIRSYSSSVLQGSTGTEPLKALKTSETVEMILGAAQITGWKDGYDAAKDKMDYQVIVSAGGEERVRMQSTPGFDALAKRASINRAAPSTGGGTNSQTPKRAPAATPKPVAAVTPRPAVQVPPSPFAAPRATPAPATPAPKKPSATDDAPLDGSKLK